MHCLAFIFLNYHTDQVCILLNSPLKFQNLLEVFVPLLKVENWLLIIGVLHEGKLVRSVQELVHKISKRQGLTQSHFYVIYMNNRNSARLEESGVLKTLNFLVRCP